MNKCNKIVYVSGKVPVQPWHNVALYPQCIKEITLKSTIFTTTGATVFMVEKTYFHPPSQWNGGGRINKVAAANHPPSPAPRLLYPGGSWEEVDGGWDSGSFIFPAHIIYEQQLPTRFPQITRKVPRQGLCLPCRIDRSRPGNDEMEGRYNTVTLVPPLRSIVCNNSLCVTIMYLVRKLVNTNICLVL